MPTPRPAASPDMASQRRSGKQALGITGRLVQDNSPLCDGNRTEGVEDRSMSLCHGFLESRVHCVPGSLCLQLFVATFLQVCCNSFFATLSKKLQLFLQKVGGESCKKKLHKSGNKVAKKCCIKVANTYNLGRNEPGTQWTWDSMNPGPNDM